MTAAPPGWLAGPGTAPEAVIREARRRQRRRRLVIGLAVAAVLAGASGVVAGIGSPAAPRRVSHPRPRPSGPAVSRLALPGPLTQPGEFDTQTTEFDTPASEFDAEVRGRACVVLSWMSSSLARASVSVA